MIFETGISEPVINEPIGLLNLSEPSGVRTLRDFSSLFLSVIGPPEIQALQVRAEAHLKSNASQ